MRAKTLKSYERDLARTWQNFAGCELRLMPGSVDRALVQAIAVALYHQQMGMFAMLGYELNPADVDADGLTQGVVRVS